MKTIELTNFPEIKYHIFIIQKHIKEKIPEKVFRETISNELVHREWMRDSCIQISMTEGEIIITSPGGLPKVLSEKEKIILELIWNLRRLDCLENTLGLYIIYLVMM